MPQIKNEAEQKIEAEKQQKYTGQLMTLVTAISAEIGRALISRVATLGCHMNARDSEKLRGILNAAGFVDTENEDDVDLVIYNTCTVKDNANRHVYGRLEHLNTVKKKRPDMIIDLCGCMMQDDHVVSKIRKSYTSVNLIFGTHNLYAFP